MLYFTLMFLVFNIRIFNFLIGKLNRIFDELLAHFSEQQ